MIKLKKKLYKEDYLLIKSHNSRD